MASAPTEIAIEGPDAAASRPGPPTDPAPPELWFDRSSITTDAMVTIEGVSEEDWWKSAPESRICEFFDGVVYMPSPATDEHQDETSFWFDLLNGFRIATRAPVRVRLGPAVLRLAPRRNPEPDLFVLPREPGQGPPALLIVEVVSNSTKAHDRGRKAEFYCDAMIPEFLLVDLGRAQVAVHRRVGEGYETSVLERGPWISASLPGFWLDVAWLWDYDKADPRALLETILAGPPA